MKWVKRVIMNVGISGVFRKIDPDFANSVWGGFCIRINCARIVAFKSTNMT